MRYAWLTLVFVCGIGDVRPQEPPANVVVNLAVKDTSGAVIPGAQATMIMSAGAVQQSVVTDRTGGAQFSLAPGTYQIAVAARGFKRAIKRIDLTESHNQSIAFQLDTSGLVECGPCIEVQVLIPTIPAEPLTNLIEPVPLKGTLKMRPHWKPK
jgi:hypothetical protein